MEIQNCHEVKRILALEFVTITMGLVNRTNMANALFYRIKVTAIEELIYSLSNQSYSKKVVVIRESRSRINL